MKNQEEHSDTILTVGWKESLEPPLPRRDFACTRLENSIVLEMQC
jgi:hypothetical protein